MRWPQLVGELRAHPTHDLRGFLDTSGVELSALLRQDRSWTTLRRDAGLLTSPASPLEAKLARRVRAVAHVDDPQRALAYRQLLGAEVHYARMSPVEQRLARMLFFALWPDGGGFSSYTDGFDALSLERGGRAELAQVVDLAYDGARHVTTTLDELASVPLQVHARYSREEILAALDRGTLDRKPAHFREGVLHTHVDGHPVDAFFITLRKSEADYSPTTLYRDYPLCPTLFHWESQSTTSVDSPTGRRYRDGSSTVLLFVRRERNGEFGTEPYTFLGPARYVRHEGDRPIAITWRLKHAIPADLYADSAVAL